jgi:hypothetical protein
MVVESRCPESKSDPLKRTRLLQQRDFRLQKLLMDFAMMFLAEWCCEFPIVVLSSCVVILNAQHTWGHSDSHLLPLLLSRLSSRGTDGTVIAQEPPPLAVR